MKAVGVLALQGAFAKHREALAALNIASCEVRRPEDLDNCTSLVIPGGESTTMTKVLGFDGWWDQLRKFAINHPVMGTCAGAILMAREARNHAVPTLGLIDMVIERNAYGAQAQSCFAEVRWTNGATSPGFFIRAPRIVELGPDVEVLATWQGNPVLVRQGQYMAATFHPELTDDRRVHQLLQV